MSAGALEKLAERCQRPTDLRLPARLPDAVRAWSKLPPAASASRRASAALNASLFPSGSTGP